MILHELQRSKNKIIIQLKYSTIVVNIYCMFQNFHYNPQVRKCNEREREREKCKEGKWGQVLYQTWTICRKYTLRPQITSLKYGAIFF